MFSFIRQLTPSPKRHSLFIESLWFLSLPSWSFSPWRHFHTFFKVPIYLCHVLTGESSFTQVSQMLRCSNFVKSVTSCLCPAISSVHSFDNQELCKQLLSVLVMLTYWDLAQFLSCFVLAQPFTLSRYGCPLSHCSTHNANCPGMINSPSLAIQLIT